MFPLLFTRYPVSGTSAGPLPTPTAPIETRRPEQLRHAFAPHDHISSLHQPLLDLLGHSSRSVYVSAGVLPAAHARVCVTVCV